MQMAAPTVSGGHGTLLRATVGQRSPLSPRLAMGLLMTQDNGRHMLVVGVGRAFQLPETLVAAGHPDLPVEDCLVVLRVDLGEGPHFTPHGHGQSDEVENEQDEEHADEHGADDLALQVLKEGPSTAPGVYHLCWGTGLPVTCLGVTVWFTKG